MTHERTDLYPDLFSAGNKIYFDHNATAPVCREVLDSARELLSLWGNPSSIHQFGRKPKKIIREARDSFAKLVDCHPLELVFTAGGSESNSLVLKSEFLRAKKAGKKEIRYLMGRLEHPSSHKVVEQLKEEGLQVDWIEFHRDGSVDLDDYTKKLAKKPHLVSCMLANNETGNIFPIKEMQSLAKATGAKFHTDAVQALGKMEFSLKDLDVDYASFAGHKFYALKGVGALFTKQGNVLEPLVAGGGQERARRGGTENVPAIASLGIVSRIAEKQKEYIKYVESLRDYLEDELSKNISEISFNGRNNPRVCNTSSVLVNGVDGETLLMNLDMQGIAVSTGAACSSGNPEPSPVLLALGLSRDEAQCSMRVSLGWGSTKEEVDHFIEKLVPIIDRLRKLKSEENS
jgi:cysteine desulfurase